MEGDGEASETIKIKLENGEGDVKDSPAEMEKKIYQTIGSEIAGITNGVENQPNGNCAVCQIKSTLRCSECLYTTHPNPVPLPYYCSKEHQLAHWRAGHKILCGGYRIRKYANALKDPKNSADLLVQSIHTEQVPTKSSPVYLDYGFSNCKTTEEANQLLNLYRVIIMFIHCDLKQLHKACMAGEIAKFIKMEYEQYKCDDPELYEVYNWFLENPDIVENPYTTSMAGLSF